jgi:hypothetical protein
MMETVPIWAPIAGVLLALGCLWGAVWAGKRRRLIDNLPTSKTTGVFIGLVELKGAAVTNEPLTSFLAEQACVYYKWSVDEHWSRTVTETYTDSEGKTQTRTRHESGWTTVAHGQESVPFYLQDDCGYILIRPEGAKIEPVTVFDETCGRSEPLYYEKGPAGGVADSDYRRRFQEQAIPLQANLYIIGQARERTDIVAPEIAAAAHAAMFLISTRSEEQLSRGYNRWFWGWNICGGVLAAAGLVARDLALHLDPALRWPFYVAAASGYAFVAAIGWLWMAYNSLIELRQRVRQAWSLVDVQLKRRHDLIPNLLSVVTSLRDYEQTVQKEVAELRGQLQATAPGVAGPDYSAVQNCVVAMAERYPELKANELFVKLQQNLIDTEQRIALARGYFNEIATHYNTRLQQIPDRFVAAIASMQPQALMAANDFERAPVTVEFGAESSRQPT